MYFPKNKGNGLKDKNGKPLKILLGNVDDIDSYLLERLMLSEVRIIPAGVGYWIEIVYDEEIIKNKEDLIKKYGLNKDIIMTIDLGVENIVAITDNIGSQPIIIKSERLKAENQWYNKRMSELNSIYDRQIIGCILKRDKKGNIRYLTNRTEKNNNKLQIATENRNNFVMDSEHKVSRFIISRALDTRAGRVVFTRNPLWKQKINIGKRNNQNFVQIPHAKLIDKTRYKGEEVGIDVEDHTEEYTSKCSFLDTESLEHHDVYIGKRIHRGLFKTPKGIDISAYIGSKKKKIIDIINTDVQGAYNLLRKVDPKFNVFDIMEGVV